MDRDGHVLGRVTSITLEMSDEAASSLPPVGGRGVGRSSGEQQATTENGDKHSRERAELSASIDAVWATYVEAMKPRRKEAGPEERKLIREALKVASTDECQRAILGNLSSAWHQGANPRSKKYNRLSHILKGRQASANGQARTTRETIDYFIDVADRASVGAEGVSSADPAKVRTAKREVLDAWEFPGDEPVVRRGEMAERWLREQGWLIERHGEGRPVFRWGGA